MGIIQKTIGGVKRMFGVKELTENFKFVKNYSQEVITSELHVKPEGKKPITENQQQLLSTYEVFKKLCTTFLIIAGLSILYSIYNFVHKHSIPAFLSLGFCLLCLSYAFRYHFWMFQITKRQLGCSFKEWLAYVTGKGA
ncbi:MAG: icmV [Gammaproteobacteria bacterium]|jgi:hypothetical protein|nr:icmV [Gammaproteobacteria bacterium]